MWTATHQMTINSKTKDFTIEDLLQCADHMKIQSREAMNIIDEVRNALLKWDIFAEKAYVNSRVASDIKNQFILYN